MVLVVWCYMCACVLASCFLPHSLTSASSLEEEEEEEAEEFSFSLSLSLSLPLTMLQASLCLPSPPTISPRTYT